jgi:hypothetical protein
MDMNKIYSNLLESFLWLFLWLFFRESIAAVITVFSLSIFLNIIKRNYSVNSKYIFIEVLNVFAFLYFLEYFMSYLILELDYFWKEFVYWVVVFVRIILIKKVRERIFTFVRSKF